MFWNLKMYLSRNLKSIFIAAIIGIFIFGYTSVSVSKENKEVNVIKYRMLANKAMEKSLEESTAYIDKAITLAPNDMENYDTRGNIFIYWGAVFQKNGEEAKSKEYFRYAWDDFTKVLENKAVVKDKSVLANCYYSRSFLFVLTNNIPAACSDRKSACDLNVKAYNKHETFYCDNYRKLCK